MVGLAKIIALRSNKNGLKYHLIILGVIALIALVVHGLWSNRREKSKYFKSANTFNRTSKNGEVNPFSQAADPNADIRLTHRAQAAQPVQQHVQPKVAPQAANQQQFNFDEQRAQVDARQIEKAWMILKSLYQISRFMR